MMRSRLGQHLAAIVALSGTVYAGDDAHVAATARQSATVMYEAFLRGDLTTFASHTYPAVVQMMGGKEQMLTAIRKGTAEMAAQGFAFKAVTVDLPLQVVTAGGDMQALLPMTLVMTAPGGELQTKGFLLGVSGDKGRTWTFLDTAKLDQMSLRRVVERGHDNRWVTDHGN